MRAHACPCASSHTPCLHTCMRMRACMRAQIGRTLSMMPDYTAAMAALGGGAFLAAAPLQQWGDLSLSPTASSRRPPNGGWGGGPPSNPQSGNSRSSAQRGAAAAAAVAEADAADATAAVNGRATHLGHAAMLGRLSAASPPAPGAQPGPPPLLVLPPGGEWLQVDDCIIPIIHTTTRLLPALIYMYMYMCVGICIP
jgi:hypothetical protein